MQDTPSIRVVLHITDAKSEENNDTGKLLLYEMERALERGDMQCLSNLNVVSSYLTKEALSWHSGRDLGTLETHEKELNGIIASED